MSKLAIALLTLSALLAAGGQLLLKIGAHGKQSALEFINIPIGAGILLYGVSMLIWIYSLSQQKLANVYAFTALTFVLVYVGAVFVIDERMSAPAGIGIVLILAGLYLITNYNPQ